MNRITETALAAFLHDIGKPFQRAESELSEQARRMESMLCPVFHGRYSHLHVLWTNDVLENGLHWLPTSLDRARINRLASQHHKPSDPEDFLISEADRMASGHDRRPAEAPDQPGFKKTPLLSIFGRLGIDSTHDSGCHLPGLLGPDMSLFPQKDPQRSLVPDYREITAVWTNTLKGWPQVPTTMACSAIASLSRRLLTFVPASTMDEPDVSLHDHACLVAAFAGALQAYHGDGPMMEQRAITDREAVKFILVSGDLSGIQSYLFDLPTEGRRGRARAYRARSFYLSMLTHAASVRLLQDLGLTSFNRVIDAGGRFVLLAHHTPAVLEGLRRARQTIDQWFLKRHAGTLTLNLDWSVRCSGNDFIGERFGDLYRRFQHATDAAKRRKLAGWLQDQEQWRADRQVLPSVNDRQRQRDEFEQDIDLGRQLPDAQYVGLWEAQAPKGGMLERPRDVLGYQMQLFSRPPAIDELSSAASFFAIRWPKSQSDWIPFRVMASYVPRLDRDDAAVLASVSSAANASRDEEDEQELPRPENLATFEHLAMLSRRRVVSNGSERWTGQPAIACLKADVDRLGFLFGSGFRDHTSFGRVATLSRMLDFFFRSFLSARFENPSQERPDYRRVYTVFAGGDDLMLVGPWHVMIDLAADLRGWFSQLTGGNEDVTLSAGLALGHGRTPISALAHMADEQLEAAKSAGRNRVALLGDVFTWPEYESALADARRLDRLLCSGDEGGRLPLKSGFVYRLLQYERMARRVAEARSGHTRLKLTDLHGELTWRSHLAYDLERNIRRRSPDTSAVNEDLNWLESLTGLTVRGSSTKGLRLSAMYALYRNRGG